MPIWAMAFARNHQQGTMNMITRNNYEEYFVLYMDNELGVEDRRMVEEFVTVHPDLKEELDILVQTKLVPDQHTVFENKEELMAFSQASSAINFSDYEGWLLLYTDNELNAAEKKMVEDFAAQHPAIKAELQLLLQTRLQPDSLIFPGKELLYRKEEKVRPGVWWRMAAAAVVFLAIGTTVFFYLNSNSEKTNTIKSVANTEIPTKQEIIKTPAIVKERNVNQKIVPAITKDKALPVLLTRVKQKNVFTTKKQNQALSNDLVKKTDNPNHWPEPDENPYYKDGITPKNTTIARTNNPSKSDLTTSIETAYTVPVTKGIVTASLPSESTSPEYDEPDGKKNKLRGFFRKVTRTFEKRTNIEATDDDDRLLVGGLAIKLK